jgi:HAD superfamily hydrolase (TIGR01509 family)
MTHDATPLAIPDIPEDPAALVFDLDGTIVDTVGTRVDAWLRTFAEVGIPADRTHLGTLIGSDGKRLAIEVAEVAGRRIDDVKAEAIDRRAGQLFGELNTDPRPLPGIREIIAALEGAGIPWTIATSSRAEQVQQSLAPLGLAHLPPLADGSQVKHAKPAPDVLLLAADLLGVPARRCWYVGDATWDMLAARAAAMTGIGITTGAADAITLRRAGAAIVHPTIVELHAALVDRRVLPA